MTHTAIAHAHAAWVATCERCLRAADAAALAALLAAPLPPAYAPDALFYRGWLASDAGDFEGAAGLFYQGAQAALLAGRVPLQHRCMAWEAYVQVQCGSYRHARALTDALDQQTLVQDPLYADIFFVRGLLASEQSSLADAQRWMERALDVARTFHDEWMEARCCANLAPIHSSQAHIEQARRMIQRARELDVRPNAARALQLANIQVYNYRWFGEAERALDYGLAAHASLKGDNKLFRAYLLLTTSVAASDLDDFVQAEALWEEAAALIYTINDDRRTLAELLWERAWLRYRQNDLAAAQRAIGEALELVDGSMETECFHAYVIGALIALRGGDLSRASQWLRPASERFRDTGHVVGQVGVLLHLAAFHLRAGQAEVGRKVLAEVLLIMWAQHIGGTFYWDPLVMTFLCGEVLGERVWDGQADALLTHAQRLHGIDATQAVELAGGAANLFAEFATTLAIRRLAHDHWRAFIPLLDHALPRVRQRAARIIAHSGAPQAQIYLAQVPADAPPDPPTPAARPAAPVQVCSFGAFRVLVNGRPLSLPNAGAAKASALLAALLIVGAQGMSRADLNRLLWPGKADFSTLNTTNSGLRKAFAQAFGGDQRRIRIQPYGDRYVLEWDSAALWWDWQELEQLAGQQPRGVRQRRAAERLYRPDWMSIVEQWLPPCDADADAQEQWDRVANTLREVVEERRATAAAWMRQLRDTQKH